MAARLFIRSKTLTLNLNRIIHTSTPADSIPATQCFRTLSSLTSQQHHTLNHGSIPLPVSTSVADEPAHRTDLAATPKIGIARSLPAATLFATLGSRKICWYEQISPRDPYEPLHAGTQALPRWFCGATKHHAYNLRSHFHHSIENNRVGKMVSGIEEGKGAAEPDPVKGKKDECWKKVIWSSPLEGRYIKGGGSGLKKESLKIKISELSLKITYALIPILLLASNTKTAASLLVLCVFWQTHGFFKEIFLDYVHHQVSREWVLVYFRLLLLILAKDLILLFDLV